MLTSPLDIPIIRQLDLRAWQPDRGFRPEVKLWQEDWDWPVFPAKLQRFIDTGVWENSRVSVAIKVDASAFTESMRRFAKTFTFMGYNRAHALIYAGLAADEMAARAKALKRSC